jgi:transposase InsO family protein
MDDAKRKIDAWRADNNRRRPHSALGNLSPNEYVKRWQSEARQKKRIS